MMRRTLLILLVPLLITGLFFLNSGCQKSTTPLIDTTAEPPAFLPPTIIPSDTPAPTKEITITEVTGWIDPSYPDEVIKQINELDLFTPIDDEEDARIKIQPNKGYDIGSWIYLAVVPMNSFIYELPGTSFIDIWQGKQTGPLSNLTLITTLKTKNTLSMILGPPSTDHITVINSPGSLGNYWSNPNTLVILPFEQINLEWRVIPVDGIDPLSPNFDRDNYLLNIPMRVADDDYSKIDLNFQGEITNYYSERISSVALTGVTALVRDTAAIMEEEGITYPALDIAPILTNTSITHISNEVPFAKDCPVPDPNQESLYFCSRDSYIDLLEFVGADIIELSGDHFADWGPEAMLHTLDLYQERDWLYYGGGENLLDGLEPVFIDHNGNSFAFIGCNGKVHEKYATATDTNPGASRCDYDWMLAEIERLDREGHIVIVTLQHEEVDSYNSIAIQQYDFGRLAEAGATIVSGSQSHHPQGFNYTGAAFIHYGLGNLFFDQWYLANYNPTDHANKDKSFIDIHFFYQGKHINTRLLPLQFIDNARPRLMQEDELAPYLSIVYKNSTWEGKPLPTTLE